MTLTVLLSMETNIIEKIQPEALSGLTAVKPENFSTMVALREGALKRKRRSC